MTKEKKKKRLKIKNLIILQYASNNCCTQVRALNLDKLPDTILSVDIEEETWVAHAGHSKQTELKIGKKMRYSDCGARYGVIGIYDRTNDEHLSTMMRHAKEATSDYSAGIYD